MRTKLLRVLAIAALVAAAFSVIVAPAGAYYESPCYNSNHNPGANQTHVGTALTMSLWGPSGPTTGNTTAHRGIKATINPNSEFHPCSYDDEWRAASLAWVSLEPSSGNTDDNSDGTDILQVGIAICNYVDTFDPCEQDIIHFWYAAGGCGGASPEPIDMGAADYDEHTIEIRHQSSPNNEYQFWIDGSHNPAFDVDNTDARVTCWINQGKMEANIFGETFDYRDGLGDPAGDSPGQLIFSAIDYKTSDGQANISPGWASSANCTNASASPGWGVDFGCDISNSVHDQMYVWTEEH